ncbi:MAG: hypothetical protein ACREOU_15645 [Candidatus Eiseniibacteriota bacterium]
MSTEIALPAFFRSPHAGRAALCAIVLLVMAGCSSEPAGQRPPEPAGSTPTGSTPSPDTTTIVEGTGTVRHQDLSGGFFGIVSDDGKQYDPVNLAEEFRQDGLRVRFRGRILRDQASIHMWGQLVELVSTERIP